MDGLGFRGLGFRGLGFRVSCHDHELRQFQLDAGEVKPGACKAVLSHGQYDTKNPIGGQAARLYLKPARR